MNRAESHRGWIVTIARAIRGCLYRAPILGRSDAKEFLLPMLGQGNSEGLDGSWLR